MKMLLRDKVVKKYISKINESDISTKTSLIDYANIYFSSPRTRINWQLLTPKLESIAKQRYFDVRWWLNSLQISCTPYSYTHIDGAYRCIVISMLHRIPCGKFAFFLSIRGTQIHIICKLWRPIAFFDSTASTDERHVIEELLTLIVKVAWPTMVRSETPFERLWFAYH